MKTKSKFKTGLYYGMLIRRVRKVMRLRFWNYKRGGKRYTYNRIKEDFKYANIDLLHYLNSVHFDNVGGLIKKVNGWLEMEAEANNFLPMKYTIGNGKNTFYTIEIERELAKRKNK